jgi:hypothetical protein
MVDVTRVCVCVCVYVFKKKTRVLYTNAKLERAYVQETTAISPKKEPSLLN